MVRQALCNKFRCRAYRSQSLTDPEHLEAFEGLTPNSCLAHGAVRKGAKARSSFLKKRTKKLFYSASRGAETARH
jgi:hypothetical protein